MEKAASLNGIDLMGIARCDKKIISEIPIGSALGAFSNLRGFGDAIPKIQIAIESGRVIRVRSHLYWSDLPGHKPEAGYFSLIEKEAKRVGKFYSAYAGHVDCRVSGFCEQPASSNGLKIREIVMGVMPTGVTYVHSYVPSLGGRAILGCVNEVHGSRVSLPAGRSDWSYDGQDCFTSNVSQDKKVFKNAETFYLYFPECSGKHDLRDKTSREKRKNFPTPGQITKAFKLIK